jgi:putative transposase
VRRYRCVDAQEAAGFPVVAACQAAGVSPRRTTPGPSAPLRDHLRGSGRRLGWSPRSVGSTPAPMAATAHRGSPRAAPARLDGQPQAGGTVDAPARHRRLPASPPAQPDQGDYRSGARAGPGRPPVRPDHLDVAWCGDVTYIPTDEGWLYLASVIELASRHLLVDGHPPQRRAGLRRPGRRGDHRRSTAHGRHDLPH